MLMGGLLTIPQPQLDRGKRLDPEVVGWVLASRESEHLAERLIRETIVKQGVARDRWRCPAESGATLRPMGRNPVCYNYRATLIPKSSCLKPVDTFRRFAVQGVVRRRNPPPTLGSI
jgi:hypothetical protein